MDPTTPIPDPADNPAVTSTDVSPTPDETPQPPATETDETPRTPSLSLWELMRKDTQADDNDATSRILINPRPSIWDLA